MNSEHDSIVSRREWLGGVSLPALAASLGAARAADEPAASDGSNHGARIYGVCHFGAKGDGQTLDTVAGQAAIDASHKETKRGANGRKKMDVGSV